MLRTRIMRGLAGAAFALAMAGGASAATLEELREFAKGAPEDAWREVDPDNLLYLQLGTMSARDGWIVIEMFPDVAPAHVARIRELVSESFYDNILFHRVIDRFMAQAGDPQTKTGAPRSAWGTQGSEKPAINAEFTQNVSAFREAVFLGRDNYASRVGFYHGLPINAQPERTAMLRADNRADMWPAHCPGVMSMARTGDPNSANSQFFLMVGDARNALDHKYTVWGRVVRGQEHTKQIARGEPPEVPTPIKRMRLAADVPAAERYDIEVLRTDAPFFEEYVEMTGEVTVSRDEEGRERDRYVDGLCNIRVPARIDGEVEL